MSATSSHSAVYTAITHDSLKNNIVFGKILGTKDIFSLNATIRAGNCVAKCGFFERTSLNLVQAGLAEGVPASQNPRHLVNLVILETTNRTLLFLH